MILKNLICCGACRDCGGRLPAVQVEVPIADEGHEMSECADEEDYLRGKELDLQQQQYHKSVQWDAEDIHHRASNVLRNLLRLYHAIRRIEQPHSRLNYSKYSLFLIPI